MCNFGYLSSGESVFTWARMWGSVVIFRSQKGPAGKEVRETLVYGMWCCLAWFKFIKIPAVRNSFASILAFRLSIPILNKEAVYIFPTCRQTPITLPGVILQNTITPKRQGTGGGVNSVVDFKAGNSVPVYCYTWGKQLPYRRKLRDINPPQKTTGIQ